MPEPVSVPPAWRWLAWQFNMLPSLYCHESWLPAGLSDAVLPTRQHEGAACHRYLSPWLLSKCGLDDAFEFDFRDRLRRIALLDRGSLDRLTAALGLLARSAALRRMLDGRMLARIREGSGLDEIGFIVTAPPDVVPVLRAQPASDPLADPERPDLPALGRPVLMAWASGGQEAIGKRLRLKFSRAQRMRAPASGPVLGPASPAQAAWVVEELLPRVLPRWTRLFS